MKLRLDPKFTRLRTRIKDLHEFNRAKRHPIAGVCRFMTIGVRTLCVSSIDNHLSRAIWPVDCGDIRPTWRIAEDFRVGSAKSRTNVVDIDCNFTLLESCV